MLRPEHVHLEGRLDGPFKEEIPFGILLQGRLVNFADVLFHRIALDEYFQMKNHEIEKILPRFAAQADLNSPAHDRGQIDFFNSLAADAGKGLDDDFHIDGI